MTSESMVTGRRSTVLAAAIGTALAAYAGGAQALEFEFDNGTRINWNTTLSVGSSWRAESPHPYLYTRADGSLIGKWSGEPLMPGQYAKAGDGLAGNQAGGDGNLNWGKGDRFSTPFKIISDVEIKKGNYGALVRVKPGTTRRSTTRRSGSATRPITSTACVPASAGAGYGPCTGTAVPPACIPLSGPGSNIWPRRELSDEGFEDEQKFDNLTCRRLRLRFVRARQHRPAIAPRQPGGELGRERVHPGREPDQPGRRSGGAAPRRRGSRDPAASVDGLCKLGLSFGSIEAFYQFQWNNTSVDGCGQYFTQSGTQISADPGQCRSITSWAA